MKALIIGAAGFVGKYLIRHLRDDCGWNVSASKLPSETMADASDIKVYDLDILDRNAIGALLEIVKPDYIFHLAAQSSVALSWQNPALTIDVNIKGAVNLLEAVKESGLAPRILLIGSGEEYGRLQENELPINEENHLKPGNIYAATKVCQNMLGKIYAEAYDMELIMVRAFNHIGPGQASTFVVADFCKQIAEILSGNREPVLRVGNLTAKRDFTDVRDIVRAYSLLIEKGEKGETYNVGSGKAVSIDGILRKLLTLANIPITVEVDPAKFRPVDVPIIVADITKLQKATGWEPQKDIMSTIEEMLHTNSVRK